MYISYHANKRKKKVFVSLSHVFLISFYNTSEKKSVFVVLLFALKKDKFFCSQSFNCLLLFFTEIFFF